MKVSNPKLILYAFHLRNNLPIGEDQPVDDANHLWEQCQQIGQKLNISRLESLIKRLQNSQGNIGIAPSKDNPKGNYLELLQPENTLDFFAIPNGSTMQLRGAVYPLQIYNTYAVDITLRFSDSQLEVEQLAGLNPQGYLHISPSKSFLGQTLLFFTQPEDEINDTQAFANDCLMAILPESERELYLLSAQGKLLGSPIFEYENTQENSVQPSHILIWLNCHPQTETLEEAGDYYQPLIHLLCYRHKILYTYSESRKCNREARILYKQLETQRKRLRHLPFDPAEKLIQLQEVLTETIQLSFDYATHLRDLALHRNTIDVNGKNYCFWLKQLQAISIGGEDNLDFWQEFLNHTQEKFIEQISVDLAYLIPAQQLFQQMIDTIRGVVEIEQTQSDRANDSDAKKRQQRLERLIAFVSTALAVSGVSSQVASNPVKIILTNPSPNKPSDTPELSNYLYYSSLDVLFHLVIGVVLALPVVIVIGFLQKYSKQALINPRSNKTVKLKSSTNNKLLNQANTPEVGQMTEAQQKIEIPTQPPRK